MKLIGSNKAVRSPEFHKRKVWESRLKIFGLFVFVIVILAGPIFLLRANYLVISNIQITGNEVTPSEEIESIVREHLTGYYWKVLPTASVLLYPDNKIESAVLTDIPRLSEVKVSLRGTRTIRVSVTERQPHALYCTEKCFFLDETGYIYSDAPNFSGDVYMVYATDPALEEPIRTQLFETEELRTIETFLNRARALGITPDVLTRTGNEFELTQKKGPVLRWNSDQDYEELAINLESFLKNGEFKPADIASMIYIDLRFGNKVFYKFQ